MDVKTLSEVIANQGFPIALSILLIFRIDKFMQEIVTAQKEGYRQVLENTKEIHSTITSLNQQNREYLSLIHISEPTRLGMISYAVFCLKKKKTTNTMTQIK